VDVRPREKDLDVHAALRGRAEAFVELGVRHEVGGRDPYALPRELEQEEEQRRDVAPSGLRGSSYRLDERRAVLGLMGEAVDTRLEEHVVRLEPVVEERRSEPIDRWATD